MLDKLISDGVALEAEVKGLTGNVSLSDDFEKWAALAAEILDTKFKSELVKHQADIAYKSRHTNPDSKRRTILGCLRAAKEIQDTKKKFDDNQTF